MLKTNMPSQIPNQFPKNNYQFEQYEG